MGVTSTAFSYKQGSSFLHRCPAWIKILVIPLVSILAFYLPPVFAAGLLALQTLVSLILHFTLKEILADLKAIIYYAFFLIIVKIIGNLMVTETFHFVGFFQYFFVSEKETWLLLLKLFCVMQSASLIFKSSTSLQIREGFVTIEFALRTFFHLSKKAPLAQTISIFVFFIPQVSKNWQQAKLAWRARGGKRNLKMLSALLPVFFSVGMKQAYNSARAISIREKKQPES